MYSFVESVKSTYPFYAIRLLGGTLYLGGIVLMGYNVFKTVVGNKVVNPEIPAVVQSSTATSAHA